MNGEKWRHGHVVPLSDGRKARCGGPHMCKVCRAEREWTLNQQGEWRLIVSPRDLRELLQLVQERVVLPNIAFEIIDQWVKITHESTVQYYERKP